MNGNEDDDEYINEEQREPIFFCRRCSKCFPNREIFDEHIQSHIDETDEGSSSHMSYIESFFCPQCDKKFEIKSDLIIHFSTVCLDGPFICKHCRQNCKHIYFLRQHLLYFHKYTDKMLKLEGLLKDIDDPLLTGDVFEKRYGEGFEFHHTNDLRYTIGYNPGFRYIQKVNDLAIDLVDKRHVCSHCNKSFSRKCVLDTHEKHCLEKKEKMKIKFGTQAVETNSRKITWKPSKVGKHWFRVKPRNKFKGEPPGKTTRKIKKTDIFEVTEKYSGIQKSFHHSDDIDTTSWKKIKLKRKFKRITLSEQSMTGTSEMKEESEMKLKGKTTTISSKPKTGDVKHSDIFEIIKQHTSMSNADLPLSDHIETSTWKKIELKRKIKRVTISDHKTSKMVNKSNQMKLRSTKAIALRGEKGKVKNSHVFDVAVSHSKAMSSLSNTMTTPNKIQINRKIKRQRKVKVSSSDHRIKEGTSKNIMKVPAKDGGINIPDMSKPQRRNRVQKARKSFVCDICRKKFIDGYKLRRHSFIHSGIRPFKCEKCQKSFSREDHLKRHAIRRVCSQINMRKRHFNGTYMKV